jgi:hypothetical protein
MISSVLQNTDERNWKEYTHTHTHIHTHTMERHPILMDWKNIVKPPYYSKQCIFQCNSYQNIMTFFIEIQK